MLNKTQEVLNYIANDDFFKNHDVRFVGGTALSIILNHRLSEDLDFAIIEFDQVAIERLMKKYGATKIKHDDILIDSAKNDGENIDYNYQKYLLDDIKIEFFSPPFNLLEENEIWKKSKTNQYLDTNVKIASLDTIVYMKTMAFWSRKKYRDLFDIYFLIENKYITAKDFIENYKKYNITYTTQHLLEKIKSKNEFYEKPDDEGIHTLVTSPKEYEWYRNKIENFIYDVYLEELYR